MRFNQPLQGGTAKTIGHHEKFLSLRKDADSGILK